MWLNAKGRIEVNDGVRIVTNVDINKYYQWLISCAYYKTIKTQIPKHKGHITIVNPKIHKYADLKLVQKYHGRKVNFVYNPEELYISRVNFWVPAKAEIEHEIKWLLGVENVYSARNDINYWGLHLTLVNTKFKNI